MLLVVPLWGCGKKAASAARDGGRDGASGDGQAGDGPRDALAERVADGGTLDGPVPCNGRCAGTCRGVCTGICSQRTDEGECSGRCEEICVGSCEGVCTRLGRADGGGADAARDVAGDRRPDGTITDAAALDARVEAGGDAGLPPDAPGPDPALGSWSNRANTGTLSWPPAGHSGALAFDSARGKVVMFGGGSAAGNATWEWDGATGAWELRQQMAGVRPSRRYGHAMAYDTARAKVVLYGGIDETGGSNAETWEWDGAAETWTMKNPGPNPSRWGHAMAYHAGMSRIVMFGGSYRHPTLGDGDLFDIWEYDGAADAWVNKTYPLPPAWPRARRGHALAYDAGRAVTVMYGGEVQALAGAAADLWEWDSTSNQWTDRTPTPLPDPWPGPRAWHGLCDVRGTVVLFGGATPNLWEWDGAAGTWRNLTPAPLPASWPPPRPRAPLAWDETRKVLVVSGGLMMVGSNALADVWEWSRP
jgi:hypothetical protein